MSDHLTFLVGVGASVGASVAVAVYLQRHLRAVLDDLCGTRVRADFWTAFSNVTLVLVPLICALAHPQQTPPPPLHLELASQIKWALVGLAGAVIVLGFVLSWFILSTALSPGSRSQDGVERAPKGA